MRTTPEDAIQGLRMELEKVKQLPELAPEARDQFASSLESALREGYRQKTEVEHRRQEDMERAAAARENALQADKLVQDQQKVKQLIDRVVFLVRQAGSMEGEEAQKEYADAGDVAATAAISPPTTRPDAATIWSLVKGYYYDDMKLEATARGDSWTPCLPATFPRCRSTTCSRSSTPTRSDGRN